MTLHGQKTDDFFDDYIRLFLQGNKSANYLADDLDNCGVGLMPLIDHCTLRTLDVDRRAEELTLSNSSREY